MNVPQRAQNQANGDADDQVNAVVDGRSAFGCFDNLIHVMSLLSFQFSSFAAHFISELTRKSAVRALIMLQILQIARVRPVVLWQKRRS